MKNNARSAKDRAETDEHELDEAVGGYDDRNTSRPGRYFVKNTDEPQAKQNEKLWNGANGFHTSRRLSCRNRSKGKNAMGSQNTSRTNTRGDTGDGNKSLRFRLKRTLRGPNEQRKGAAC